MTFAEVLDVAYGMQVDEAIRLGNPLDVALDLHSAWERGVTEADDEAIREAAVKRDELAERRRTAARNRDNFARMEGMLTGVTRKGV